MEGKHSKVAKKSKKGNTILLIILILIFISSMSVVIYWIKSNYDLAKIEEEVISKVITVNEQQDNELKGHSISVDFDSLEQINSEIKAWIYIKGTDINYPILQTKDNEYYLKRDIYKKYSSCGSIFLDCNSKENFLDDNTIIYGHNLKNQKMFADLGKIYNGDLGNKIEIEIYTKETFKKYEIMTVYMEEPNLEIIKRNFKGEEKQRYITNNVNKSKIKFEYIYRDADKLLTLVTCDSTGKNRIIVTSCKKN